MLDSSGEHIRSTWYVMSVDLGEKYRSLEKGLEKNTKKNTDMNSN